MAYAFQCKNCGRLVSSADAGEREFPAACPSCGHGVKFDPVSGVKSYEDADNWEALADLSESKQKKLVEDHGDDSLIEAHTPAEPDANPDHEPTSINREANEALGQEDKP